MQDIEKPCSKKRPQNAPKARTHSDCNSKTPTADHAEECYCKGMKAAGFDDARGFQETRHSTIPHERTRITSCTATPCERTTPYYKSVHRDSPYCKVHSGYASTASERERASRTSSSDDPGSSDRSSS